MKQSPPSDNLENHSCDDEELVFIEPMSNKLFDAEQYKSEESPCQQVSYIEPPTVWHDQICSDHEYRTPQLFEQPLSPKVVFKSPPSVLDQTFGGDSD
jgi:hypothetical protein